MSSKIHRLSGEDFEKYIMKVLKLNGYKKIRMTQGSNDYGVDILCKKAGLDIAVQCKNYASKVGVNAVQQVYAGAAYYECDHSILIASNYFTKQAIRMAQGNGVELWDIEKLEEKEKNFSLTAFITRFFKFFFLLFVKPFLALGYLLGKILPWFIILLFFIIFLASQSLNLQLMPISNQRYVYIGLLLIIFFKSTEHLYRNIK